LGAEGYGDSIVALDPSDLHVRSSISAAVAGVDDSDVGGAVMLQGDRGYVEGKSGYLYLIDWRRGKLLGRYDLKPFARNGGGIGTPTGDGSGIAVTSGTLANPWDDKHSTNDAGGDLVGLDMALHERYRLHSGYPIQGYAAFVRGVGFAALDQQLVAFESTTGAILWKGVLDDLTYASPTVVPSGVYEITNSGTVFAFGLP
jgi:hypothetical protein